MNNSWIFGAEDLERIQNLYTDRQEIKIYWPYISRVGLNKDFSLQVVISENLLLVQEKYQSELNEDILELVIESAIDDRIRFPGRRLRNNSAQTLNSYL